VFARAKAASGVGYRSGAVHPLPAATEEALRGRPGGRKPDDSARPSGAMSEDSRLSAIEPPDQAADKTP